MTQTPDKVAPVLIGHGSRHPKTAEAGERFRARVSEILAQDVALGWLDYCAPSITDVLAAQSARGTTRLAAQPLMLTPAGHVTSDIPTALATFRGEVTVGTPLGDPTFLHDLLLPFATDTLPQFDTLPTIFVIARDSHGPTFKQAAEALGDMLRDSLGLELKIGYVGATDQKWETVLTSMSDTPLLVLPTLLFPGRLWDSIASHLHARPHQTELMPPLSDNPALAQRVAQAILALQEKAARDC